MTKQSKPLGHKAYGSIPHFNGSRVGESDKHCSEGHQRIMTEKVRDKNDLIIVQEKLDGSNCSIAKIKGELIALTRSGYKATTSPYYQHHMFDEWVMDNYKKLDSVINEGERLCGEWLIQAHGTRYKLHHVPFVAFDIMVKHERMCYHDFLFRILPTGIPTPKLLHVGQSLKLDKAKDMIKISGHGAIDDVEGFVYRCERSGKVDFLCKWVNPNKKDGIYLPEISGKEAVYNIDIN